MIRGLNSRNVGLVYVASHSFHMKDAPLDIMRAAGDKLRLVHVADTMDHHASHGLRYITNPPGNPVRVHQHLKIGDGDVNWDEFFGGLQGSASSTGRTLSWSPASSPRTTTPRRSPATSWRP